MRVNIDSSTRLYGRLYAGERVVVVFPGIMAMVMFPRVFCEVIPALDSGNAE